MSKQYKLTTKKKGISETFHFSLPKHTLLECYEQLNNHEKNAIASLFAAKFNKHTAQGNMVKIIRRDKRLSFEQYIYIQSQIEWMLSNKREFKVSRKALNPTI